MTATPSPTLFSASGTPVSLLPLSTAWPSAGGCSSYIYEQVDGHFLGWDPYYGQALDPSARTCLPPQATSWWFQSSAATSTALGPDFVCPGAYSAVQTSLVASETQYIYCCPSGYSLYVVQPNTVPQAFPSQCTSKAAPGQELAFLTPLQVSQGFFFAPTTSTVQGSTVTVFGIPVNGYNIPQRTSSSASSTTTSSTSSAGSGAASGTASGPSPSPTASSEASKSGGGSSIAVPVGVSVGVVLGVLAIAGGLFLLWQRRRRRLRDSQFRTEAPAGQPGHGPPPVSEPKYELVGDLGNAELPGEPTVHELPGRAGGGSGHAYRRY